MTKKDTRTKDDNAKRKRRSRANQADGHKVKERTANRARMAVHRAKKQALKTVARLKSLLSEAEREEVDALAVERRHILLKNWFNSRRLPYSLDKQPGLKKETLQTLMTTFMTVAEVHEFDLQMAQYKICIMTRHQNAVDARANVEAAHEGAASSDYLVDESPNEEIASSDTTNSPAAVDGARRPHIENDVEKAASSLVIFSHVVDAPADESANGGKIVFVSVGRSVSEARLKN